MSQSATGNETSLGVPTHKPGDWFMSHARAAGAHGYFEPTHDLSDITSSNVFNNVGHKYRTTVRFSTGRAADTAREHRGFAIKIRTEEGNLDWTFNNFPIFYFKDPEKFLPLVRATESDLKEKDPQTDLEDPDRFWSYLSQTPESIHHVMMLYSDRGTPDGYHNYHGYSANTYKFTKEDGSFVYTQIHVRADNGFKTLTRDEADRLVKEDPDYGKDLLFNAIERGNFPSWTVYIQTMTPDQAKQYRYNVFDLTKVWPHADFPLRPIGKLVLNENPKDFDTEIRYCAFSPSRLIPYLEVSDDPVLLTRTKFYARVNEHRLGQNYHNLPINLPLPSCKTTEKQTKTAAQLLGDQERKERHKEFIALSMKDLAHLTELDFEQPRKLWQEVFDDEQRQHFITNTSSHLRHVTSEETKMKQLAIFAAVDQTLADRIADAMGVSHVEPLSLEPVSEALKYRLSVSVTQNEKRHKEFIALSMKDLAHLTELDFEQPRKLWQEVFDDEQRQHFITNTSSHLRHVTSEETKMKQLAIFAAVDQTLADRIADAMGVSHVEPLSLEPVSEALKYRLRSA